MNKDIFIEHPLLHKNECKKNTNVLVKKLSEKIIEQKQEDDDKLIRRKSNKLKKCRKLNTKNSLLKVDSPEVDSPEVDSSEVHSPEVHSPEVHSPEVHTEVDSPEVDSPEVHSPEVHTEVDSPEVDSPEVDSPEVDSPEVDSPEVHSPEVDKVFSKFKLNNIIYFYDDKDQKCVLKNNSDNLFSIENPTESKDSNYKLMEDTNFQMDNIEKNSFLMTEIGKKQVDIVEEDNNNTCIII